MLSQQGNYAISKDGTVLWHEEVTSEQEKAVRELALKLTDEFAAIKKIHIPDRNDIFENRGSQFASSVLGFHASNELKYIVDPDQSIRRDLLAYHSEDLAALRKLGIEAMPAGTTTIDFILEGKHKGYNIMRFTERMGWKKGDCIYFGDALFPSGNDETVIGVIPTRAVKDPDDTFIFIKQMLD
jgi:hydroxymethylpyrimidine pyrophosphatase-like HAD family hydrolase